jgi:uncharacterized repeat protein (TIGR01451 family)
MTMIKHLLRQMAVLLAVISLLLSTSAGVFANTFVGPSTITIDASFSDWGTVAAPTTGVYLRRDFTNTGSTDGSGFAGTAADLNYFWNALSTQSGGSASASASNLIQNIYYRIDTFTTAVISPGQLYNIQLNLGVAAAGKADHLLQIWVNNAATPKVTIVLYSYSTPYPAMGAYTSGTLTGRVSNVASPYPGYTGAVDPNATGAYGKYDGTNYGIEVKIPISWYGNTYGGLVKNNGSGAPTYYGVIFTSTGTLGAVGTVKDTMGKSDGIPVYLIVDAETGETHTEDLKTVNITATKTDSIYTDVSPTGAASPGDVLLYTVIITNLGPSTAKAVVFQDTITDPYLIWANNVTTTAGTVTRGNTAGDNGCTVNIGNMVVDSTVTITFRAQIKASVPAGVNKVTNQGLVSGSNFASLSTDDPRTLLANDATVTSISPTDMVEPYKTWALTIDADGNGYPSPGDTLTYTVTLENLGNANALNVVFTDIPDVNSTLVAGSVTTTLGTVTKGNIAGDKSVAVNVGTIPGGQGTPVTITFRVTVNSPLPFGVTQLSNQGIASGSNFPADPTDDPTDQSYDNPTDTSVTAAPLIEAFKRYELTDDVNKDGMAGPGDNLTYIITIANTGNQSADGVTFSDTIAANTTLIVGTTFTSQGTVTSETPTGVAVNVGTIPGGNYTVNISFKVSVNAGATGGISNQGTVTATSLANVPTDDPNTHTLNDATYTSIALGPPDLRVTKSAILAVDADNNNVASPGDTLQYIIAINNEGGSAATSVNFTDTLDANTTLVAGSTTTSQPATITETPASVSAVIGTIEGGATHSICLVTFRVTINNPFPVNTDTVTNQGTVTAAGPITVKTDDPDTAASADATVTAVYADPLITATKTDSVFTDVLPAGASPGDTLLYTITITNTGTTTARSVIFEDTITDPYLTLTSNSVTTTQGTIIKGNVPADKAVQVNLVDVPVGSPVTITFKASITSPLPAYIEKVSNQGTVYGLNFASVPTDDPRTLLASDPTSTAISPTDMVEPYKTWALTVDADHNGIPSPGDTLTYTVTLENVGNHNASGVVFTDIPDINSTLVTGSVTTTLGTVTEGNNVGDNAVKVNIGTLPGPDGTATITFRVIVNSPLPPGVTQISNQGFVSGSNFPTDPTDDPTDQSYDNPTVTPLTAAPLIEAYKHFEITDDINKDGMAGPGDTLTYFITINNKGNQNATGVSFSDTVDTNTSLVVGSTVASQGAVTSETATGVTVNVGTIPGGGGTVNISFRVTIKPGATTGISNQGTVTSDGGISVKTDDPNTHTINDATYTAIALGPPELRVTKSAILAVDADNNNVASPGDTLQYIIAINNEGGSAATNIVFTDNLNANISLVAGSTSTSQTATITETPTSVTAAIGTLEGGATHSICLVTFKVLIKSPLSADSTPIPNQGTVTATGLPPVLTDDPNTATSPDATIITAHAQPLVTATKLDSVFTDADGNGAPSPGDTLLYTIVITNSGETFARAVVFYDAIADGNLTLADNVIAPPGGSILLGNTPGDHEVQVNIGDIAAGDSRTITFHARISNPVPPGILIVSNQGSVSGSNFTTITTDDPRTSLENDATTTSISALPLVEPYKTWELITDADNNGYPSPGDTIKYTVTIENTGNQNASDVGFTDIPDPNSPLVPGSVTTSMGTVATGNLPGDTSVAVRIGTLAGNHGRATITFNVRVSNPLLPGVVALYNQGFVSGSNFPSDPTDDPSDQSYDNPTATSLSALPLIKASKRYRLVTDVAPVTGVPGPGDTLNYTITIVNNGNQNAAGVNFSDTPSDNTTLVVGSVDTSQGTVTLGNSPGDTAVGVNLGTIAGNGGTANISFNVTVKNNGSTLVSNQGTVSGLNISPTLTDDPNTTQEGDPTETQLAAATNPSLHITKAVVLSNDADHNSVPSPGDTLQYIVTINNTGNGAAANVFFDDTPDASTTLVTGSVSSTFGIVELGNTPGNTAVKVKVGTLGAGGINLVTFRVVIRSGLPSSTNTISNQGTTTGANFPPTLTGDPHTGGGNNATVISFLNPPPGAPAPATAVILNQPQVTSPARPGFTTTPHSATVVTRPWEPQVQYIPNLVVTSSSLSSTQTKTGMPVTVDAVITNEGNARGSISVSLCVDGQTESTRTVSLGSGSYTPVSFTFSADRPGEYNISINNQPAGVLHVEQDSDPNIILLISMACILVSLLLGLRMIWIRRQQNGY